MNLQTITKFASRTLTAGAGGAALLTAGDVPVAATWPVAAVSIAAMVCFAAVDAIKAWKGVPNEDK